MVTVLLKSKTNIRGNGACYFIMNSAVLVFPCCLFPCCLQSLNLCLYIYAVSASFVPALPALCEAQVPSLTLEPLMPDSALGWAIPPLGLFLPCSLSRTSLRWEDISIPTVGSPSYFRNRGWPEGRGCSMPEHPFADAPFIWTQKAVNGCSALTTDEILGEFKMQTHLSWA